MLSVTLKPHIDFWSLKDKMQKANYPPFNYLNANMEIFFNFVKIKKIEMTIPSPYFQSISKRIMESSYIQKLNK